MRSSFKTPHEIIRYPLVDSTNRVAIELASQEAGKHGTIVLADEQSGGRGRESRYFSSPPGGLYTSVILRPKLPVEKMPLVTLAAGIACADTIEIVTGIKVYLKWPNDLYSQGKKIGGILSEAAPYSNVTKNIPFVVVGIGVNVNTRSESLPDSLQDHATSLYCLSGRSYEIHLLLDTLIRSLLSEVALLQDNKDKIIAHWNKHDYLLGKHICWQNPDGETVCGTGKGLLPDGRYRLTTSGGDDYPVLAGDIKITEINGSIIK